MPGMMCFFYFNGNILMLCEWTEGGNHGFSKNSMEAMMYIQARDHGGQEQSWFGALSLWVYCDGKALIKWGVGKNEKTSS